jgi:hypothetical protein
MNITDYGLVVVNEDGEDIGEPFQITSEMKDSPQKLISKIKEVIEENTEYDSDVEESDDELEEDEE